MRAREFQPVTPRMSMIWRIFDLYTRKGHEPQAVIDAINRKFGLDLSRKNIDNYYIDTIQKENFVDGQIKGRSRPGRVKRAGASCKGSVTDLRSRARKYGGERGRMYHWCANMKSGREKSKK